MYFIIISSSLLINLIFQLPCLLSGLCMAAYIGVTPPIPP